MALKEDSSVAAEGSVPLPDVALAWKSLHKAKEVLQRIANKFDHEDWNCAKAQKTRKKQGCERSSDSGRGQEENASNEIKTGGSGLSCRETCASVSPAWPKNHSLECHDARNGLARLREPASARMEAHGGRAAASICSAPDSLRSSFSDQANAGKKSPTEPREGVHCSLQHLPSSSEDSKQFSAAPCERGGDTPMGLSAPSAMHSLSACCSPIAQKLEGLRKRSPDNKLERLKERIREQKQRHQLAQEVEQPSTRSPGELLSPWPLKRKVRKLAFAPPAPVYRGFSAVTLTAAHSPAAEETGLSETDELATTRGSGDYKKKSPDQRERRMTSRSQKYKQEQSSSKAPVPEKALKEKGYKLIGASAWREGQKLAKKLLGPPPKFPKPGSTSEEQIPKNDSEPDKEFLATPPMEQSSRENGASGEGEHMWNSTSHKSCQTTRGHSTEIASNVLTRDAKQILRDLHLQNQHCEEPRSTRPQKNTCTGKADDPKLYPEINPSSTEISGIALSDYSRHKTRSSLRKCGIETRNYSRGKSVSLPRSKGSNSPGQKASKKENVSQSARKRIHERKAHSYSPEVVHEFMHRKVEEQKKKNLEEKKASKQARETRAKRLQEVYRKQKEVVAKKSCSEVTKTSNRGGDLETQGSQYKLAQQQTRKRGLERNFVEWVHKTSCALLRSETQGSSDLHPETTQPPKATETLDFPSSLASENEFLSPLKLKDLAVCPSPAPYLPSQSFFLPLKMAKLGLKGSASEDTFSPSPYRNNQDRVKAIHFLAKELGERIEMATERLRGTSRLRDSDGNGGEEHRLFGLEPTSWPSPCSKTETSKSEQNRTTDIQTLLSVPSPNGFCISLALAQDRLDRTPCVGSPEEADAQKRKERIQVLLSDTTAVSEELLWSPNSAVAGKALKDVCLGFLVNKESDGEPCLLQEELMTSMPSPSPRFLTRSPERELANQRNHCGFDTLSEAQNQVEIVSPSPRGNLRPSRGHGYESCTSPARRIGTQKEFEGGFGRGPRCIDPEERYRHHLDNIQRTSLMLAHKLKAHQLQQEGQLAVLREKAKLEAQESQRSLDGLLKHQLVGLCNSQTSCTLRARLKHAKQEQGEYQCEGGPGQDDTAEDRSFRAQTPQQPALKTKINCNMTAAIKATERKPTGEVNLDSTSHQQGSPSATHGDSLHIGRALNPLPPSANEANSEKLTADDSGDSGEQMDSASQWSEVSQFYGGSSTFCHFSLTMAEQYLREEELRTRHQTALLRLREKALQEKTKAELAWLEHRKCCLDDLRDSKEASAIAEKQQRILTKLKQEQAEIQHLRNIYRAAHQERKLLLKQQREILLMQQSTAQLQRELRGLAGRPQFTNSPEDIEETIKQKTTGTISSPATSSMPTEATAGSERPALSRNGNSRAQLKNAEDRKYESLPTEEKTLLRCRQQTEAPKRWKQWLAAQDPEETETMAKEPCDSNDQVTHSPLVDADSQNTEISGRCHVRLHSEHPHSAKMDEATLRPLPTEDEPHEFLESNRKEKKFVLNHALAPKDNEDVHSHDSNATLSSMEELVSDTPTVEKGYRAHGGSQETAGEDKGLFSLNTANDGDRRSGLISVGPSTVEAQMGKGRRPEEQRTNADSERESDTTYVGVKELPVSKILPQQDIPLNKEEEVKVFALFEKNSAEHKKLIKHLDSDACDPFDDEPALKICSEGLASTVSSTKSHDSSLSWESVNSCHSLPEFHKVSAMQINCSETSVSDSEFEVEDTDISVPEEFIVQQQVCEGDDVFPNPLTKTPIAVSDGNELLSSEICDEQVPCDDRNHEASSLFHGSEKHHGDVSEYECAYESHSVISSNGVMPNLSASGREEPFSFPFNNTANERGQPYLEASAVLPCSEICNANTIPSQEEPGQDSDSSSRSLLHDDEFCTEENVEQEAAASAASKVEKNGESFDLSISQSKSEFMWFPPKSFLRNLDAVTEQFNNSVLLSPEKSMTDVQIPLFPIDSSLDSRDLPRLKEAKTNHTELLIEGHVSNKPNEIASSHLLRPHSSEEVPTAAEISLFNTQTFQRVAAQDQNNAATESLNLKKSEMMPLSSISSNKQLPQAKSCPSESDDMIFISDEVLPPMDKDTLSEILSPVDEVLSYGSVDLPSSHKKDFSFYSEDLPTPPEDVGGIKSDDISFSMEDFPSPPEQMTFAEMKDSYHSLNEDATGQMDELPSLSDSIIPEELPPPSPELMGVFSAQDATVSGLFWGKEVIAGVKEDLEHVTTENQTKLQQLGLPSASSPTSSGQAIKRPEQLKKQCRPFLTLSKAQEDNDDPLSSFEVGDRVLVKHVQPGTLMFKGCTCFDEGYWAGVALDKPEGEHDGTYGGVKYFVCANYCGVFVRPDQISHLLEDNEKGSGYFGDEDSFYDDGTSRGDCKCAKDNQQGTGCGEQKPEDTYSARGSAPKENESRSCMSMPSGKAHKGQFPTDDQYLSNEFTYQASLVHVEADKDTELIQVKQETVAEDTISMKNKDGHIEEVNKSKRISCLLKDQNRNKLADDLSSELTKKLLYDTLIAFSDTTEHKYKSAIEKELWNHGKGLKKEGNHSTSLSKQSGEFFDVLLSGFDTLSSHGPHTAQTVSEKIVTKFVDDAVKEYKKIKRKQGAKAATMFQVSSEAPQGSLPFLIEILDAGVFGSSEDFDQLNSIQHAKEIKTQRQIQYSLDYWHSAPWKKTTEVPLVVPHNSSHVKVLSAHAVDELWTPQNIHSGSTRNNVPKHFECNDSSDDSLEAESKRIYNQVIFDLTHELLCAEYQVAANPNPLPWLRENLGSRCSRRICRKTDVSEVKSFIQGEVIKIMNLEENSLEMKRKLLNMTKYGNCKRDRVDLILIQDLHKEESQWTDYAEDELAVKMRVTEDIFDSLVLDTIGVLKKIFLKKTRD